MTITTRLARLEARTSEPRKVYVWKDDHETPDEAMSRLYPAGPPKDAEVILLVWGTTS